MQPLMHDVSARHIDALKSNLPQSTLLTGPIGVGLLTVARAVAGDDTAAILQPRDKTEQIDLVSGTISVDMVRELYGQTRSRRTSRHIIIIDNADAMSAGAQAAFLKLLEEPTPHTHFLLTSHAPELLVPTILSRVQKVTLRPISTTQSSELIDRLGVRDATMRKQLLFIAQGLPAEITRLVGNREYFDSCARIITDARDFLTGTPYQKLCIAHTYQTKRAETLRLLDTVILLAKRGLVAKPQPQIIRELEQILDVREQIAAHHNIRLQIARIVL